jgi:NagD protein
MTDRGPLPSFLMDMDGVLVHEEQAIPGAGRFLEALQTAGLPFLVLTNNSIYTQRDLAARLARSGIKLPPEAVWTSALATTQFLDTQRPGGTASVIEGRLTAWPGRCSPRQRAGQPARPVDRKAAGL